MKKKTAPIYCIGVNISAKTFVASIINCDAEITAPRSEFTHSEEWYFGFVRWIVVYHLNKCSLLIAM